MMQTRWQAESIIRRWENSLLSPPEDRTYPLCQCCGDSIVDGLYCIKGRYYDEDCAKQMCREVVIDEPAECSGCEEVLENEYYAVGDDCYCEECFDRYCREE